MQATIQAIKTSVASMAQRKFDVSSRFVPSKAFMRSTFKNTLKKFIVDDDSEQVQELIDVFNSISTFNEQSRAEFSSIY